MGMYREKIVDAGVEAEVHGLPELEKLTWRKSSSRPAGVIVKIPLKNKSKKKVLSGLVWFENKPFLLFFRFP